MKRHLHQQEVKPTSRLRVRSQKPLAVIYVRSATSDQLDPLVAKNVRAQYRACRRKAKQLGAAVEAEYADIGASGLNMKRPAMKRLLGRLKRQPRIQYLIAHRLDRLTRSRHDQLRLSLDLEAANVTVVSCSEEISDRPSATLIDGLMSAMTDWYSREHSRRVKEGIARSKRPARDVPFGYKRERGRRLDADREPAELVRRAFKTRASSANLSVRKEAT